MEIKQFINELMSSNCYVIYDKQYKGCIVVDPGSKDSKDIINFCDVNHIIPLYLILTHEHTDHTWGCNTLIDKYNSKVVCSNECRKALPKEGQAYFSFYYDDPNYTYTVKRVDIIIDELNHQLIWEKYKLKFLLSPGHSKGSMCFSIDNSLFTGDTIMKYKPYISKKSGEKDTFEKSRSQIFKMYSGETIVYPGHGESFILQDINNAI